MTISEVYSKFRIPPNLQEHMLRVCSIVEFISQHLNNKVTIDWKLVREITLLHDLGNIVKFDFEKHPEFLGKEEENVEYWKQTQKQIISQYGSNDHDVTKKMLEEVNLNKESIEIILNKSFGNSVSVSNSKSWPLKILYYADLRTLPFGVGNLEERINDIKSRMPQYTSRPDFEDLVSACKNVEKQIQENIDISVNEINDANVSIDKNLLNTELSC
jgi:hypothetical protein